MLERVKIRPLQRRRAELVIICIALVTVVGSLVGVALVSMELLSAARGYTQGEALWSKGQKDAIFYLTRYAHTRSNTDYERFLAAIRIPLACRSVRQQMDLPHFNRVSLARGFAEVGIHQDDRERMVSLYRHFGAESHLAQAVAVWKDAESRIDRLQRNGDFLHRQFLLGVATQEQIDESLAENDRINRELTPLEARFSASLAAASRWLHRLLATAISMLAALLIVAGSTAFYILFLRIARSEQQLREARDQALNASKTKSQFLANMSHEIRTPMNGVLGMINLALDQSADSEQNEQLRTAQTAAHSLLTIINDILDLSKIEAEKMSLEAIDFDLRDLAAQVLRMFVGPAEQKHIRAGLAFADGCPEWVCGDPIRLRQILVNLVGNAVKFTARGYVAVRISGTAEGIRFEVRDTGIGIPAEKIDAIFEPFTQADGSHTRQFGGSGLGLTITRRLIALMQGRIWVESKEGFGSCFFVELPLLSRPPVVAQPAKSSPMDAPRDLPQLKVLVAEDNAINQKVISALIKRLGWKITLAGNGKEALDRFLEARFDIVLMDVQMPEVDGFEATRLIRKNEESGGSPTHTPIVAVTAHAGKQEHDACLAAGMDAVITKPIDVTELVRVIAGLLEGETVIVP